ncbi:MAG: fasciclin domain-containing protein [Erythrobacter sp.]|nr:MAG: fasciclin domain-containing protein [Erythrobacter sp.]
MSSNTPQRRVLLLATVSAFLLALSACGNDGEVAGTADASAPGTQTIAALISRADDLSRVEELMEDGGLSQTFDGTAAYTFFAPTDAALDSLGEEFTGEEARPALLAMLRRHVVPGYLTAEDIAAAVASNRGPVEMQTMGEGTLTFAMDGENVAVSLEEGAASAVLGEEMLGANGVVIPIEGVLADIQPGG